MTGFQKRLLVGFAAIVFWAGPALGQPLHSDPHSSSKSGAVQSPATDELRPVAVPEPSEKALRYYRSGNGLWAINQVWAILLTGTLAFSGASARLRTLAQRMVGNGF